MPQNLTQAHEEWAKRRPDERFDSLESLHRFTSERKSRSIELSTRISKLRVVEDSIAGVALNGLGPTPKFTHWSFGQLTRLVGAPGRYLRTLPRDLVRDCLSVGVSRSKLECKLLVRGTATSNPDDNPESMLAAVTGPGYGRIWDADVVEMLLESIQGSDWCLPPSNGQSPTGLYASDRDVFAFFVNDSEIIEVAGSRLGKGFFCWNSETGSASFGFTMFLYNYVCGNHIVWGAEDVQEVRIEHRDQAERRFREEAIPVFQTFLERGTPSEAIRTTIDRAARAKIGSSIEDVLKWFKGKPFSREEIESGWSIGKEEGEDVTNLWGIIQGLTAHARSIPFVNHRIRLERKAGALLRAKV